MTSKGREAALISEILRNVAQCENFGWSEQTDSEIYDDMPPLAHIDYNN
jgi:hypothetical protein